jgi:hypothetical protein
MYYRLMKNFEGTFFFRRMLPVGAVCLVVSILFSGCGSGTAVPTTVKYKPDKSAGAEE